MKHRTKTPTLFSTVFLVLVLYVIVAATVFRFRHPWLTGTEQFIYLPEAMCWETVDYQEMRERSR